MLMSVQSVQMSYSRGLHLCLLVRMEVRYITYGK